MSRPHHEDDVDPLFVETVDRLLGRAATFEAVESAEAEGWSEPLWKLMAEAGFPWISVPEHAGGTGGTVADAMAMLRRVGAHAAPVPVAETGVLGGWLSASAGFDVPDGPLTVIADPGALDLSQGQVSGVAVVAWASRAHRILGIVPDGDGSSIVSLTPDQVSIVGGTNLAGEPRETVSVDVSMAEVDHRPAPAGVDGAALRLRGALSRVNLAAGALSAMSQLTIDYTNERRQFGKPVASFQAVQQHLVTAAQAAARAEMAAAVATRAVARGGGAFEVAAAKVVVDRAVVEATRAAHQAHGAMGVTREYPLHHLSRRLWAWRHEYGTARQWRDVVGRSVGAGGADGLWPLITT